MTEQSDERDLTLKERAAQQAYQRALFRSAPVKERWKAVVETVIFEMEKWSADS